MNKKIIFTHVAFLSTSEVSFVFNIPSSHAYPSLPKRRFLNEQFLISKCSRILHALLPSQSHVLGFHI